MLLIVCLQISLSMLTMNVDLWPYTVVYSIVYGTQDSLSNGYTNNSHTNISQVFQCLTHDSVLTTWDWEKSLWMPLKKDAIPGMHCTVHFNTSLLTVHRLLGTGGNLY